MILKDILNQEIDVPCLGCAIGTGAVVPPGQMICATEHFVLHQDPLLPIAGFLIVASKAHLRSITELDELARHEMVELVYQGLAALKAAGISQEVTIVQEERSGHFHIWLFPWHTWMDEAGFSRSVASLRAINDYAQKQRSSLEEVKNVLDAVESVRAYFG